MAGLINLLLSLAVVVSSGFMGLVTWKQFSGGLPPSLTAVSELVESARALPLFAWHPLFMSVGMLPAAAMAYACIDPRKREMRRPNRVVLTQMHAAWMLVSALSLAAGFYCIYQNKNLQGRPHYQSPHSKLGLACVAAYAAAYVAAWRRTLVPLDLGKLNFNWNCRLHRSLGKAAFLTAGVAVVTGGYTGFGKSAFPEDTMTLLAGAILVPQVLMVVEAPRLLASLMPGRKATAE